MVIDSFASRFGWYKPWAGGKSTAEIVGWRPAPRKEGSSMGQCQRDGHQASASGRTLATYITSLQGGDDSQAFKA